MPLYDGLWAIDPSNPANVATDANVTIFDPNDPAKNPVSLTDADGLPVTNPLVTNARGFVGAFRADLKRVGWVAGDLVGYLGNFDSIAADAETALSDSAQAKMSAAESAQAAKDAASMVQAPSDSVIATLAGNPESETGSLLRGEFLSRNEIVVNVRDFGAVGDGVTDDTDAFQAAMDMAWGSFGQGGKLLIPPGDYWPRLPVKLREGVDIEGQGWPILRRRYGDPFYAIFVGLSEGRRGYGSGPSNWTASGIEFRGTFKDGAERSAGPFALHHVQNATIEKNRFIECHIKGHVIDLGGCDNIKVRNNLFMGMKQSDGNGIAEAVQLDQSKNGSLSYADLPGSYDGLLSRNITIENNDFLPLTVDGVWYPASNIGGNHTTRQGVYYENIKIIGNYVEDPILTVTTAFRGNVHLQGAKGVEILRNRWVSTKGGNTKLIAILTVAVGNGLDNDPEVVTPVGPIPPQGCLDVRIEGNTFEGFNGAAGAEYLVHLWGDATGQKATDNVQVISNTFRNNFGTSGGSDPIRIQDVAGVEVRANRYRGKNTRALYTVSVDGLSITDNEIDSSETQVFWVEGSTDVTLGINKWSNTKNVPRIKNCTGVTVYGNRASKPVASGLALVLEGCTAFSVSGNNFRTSFTSAAAIALSGTNTNGQISNNTCFGYTAPVQGTGTNVTVGTNPV